MKLLVLGVISVVFAVSARTTRQVQRAHFLADGSNDVAVNIMQDIVGKEKNAVFSPLGYMTILAVLTEGARENTRNQLVSSLKLPEDTYAVRSTFKRILSDLTERDVINKPEFRNWFYVYKNYTVEESYKTVLKDNYLIDVKEIDRYYFPDEETDGEKKTEDDSVTAKTKPEGEIGETMMTENTLQAVADDDSKEDESKENESTEKPDEKKDSSEEKKSKEKESDENSSEEKPVKKPSNVMKIKEKTKPAMSGKAKYASVDQMEMEAKKPETTEAQKVEMESTEGAVDMTTVVADKEPLEIDVRRATRDTASDLSANRLASMSAEREMSLKKLSRMMAFNALYFKGNWTKRFTVKTEKTPFKVSASEVKEVDMIHAEDDFDTGRVPELDATALDIPYQGERYSLLILVPDNDNGLEPLLKKLPGMSFYNIDKHLTRLPARVCIPKLKFYTISRAKDAFMKSGITDIFNENADLSGISGNKGLFLEEIVQLVTFEIDNNESSFNYLTTSDVSDLRSTPVIFKADKPFVFFLRDKVENLNIVAGMVTDPSLSTFEKE